MINDADLRVELQNIKGVRKSSVLIVIIGRVGKGKSSLINSLFGENVVKAEDSPDPVTKSVTTTSKDLNGITVTLVDTPGFCALDNDKSMDDIMKDIADSVPERGEEVDLVIYCSSMAPDSRVEKSDGEIVQKLTEVYGFKIWDNTLFALTYANLVTSSRDSSDVAKATHFCDSLCKWQDKIHSGLLNRFGNLTTEKAHNIPVIPVGYSDYFDRDQRDQLQHQSYTLPDGSNWLSNFWYQVFKRIKDPAKHAFFKASYNIHPFIRVNEHRELTQIVDLKEHSL